MFDTRMKISFVELAFLIAALATVFSFSVDRAYSQEEEAVFDWELVSVVVFVDRARGIMEVTPEVQTAVGEDLLLKGFDFPLQFLVESDDPDFEPIFEDDHRDIQQAQNSPVCDLGCARVNIWCKEMQGSMCPNLMRRSRDMIQMIPGKCGIHNPFEKPDKHMRVQHLACSCLYWASAWKIEGPPPRPRSRLTVTVNPKRVVFEDNYDNNSVTVMVR